MAVAVLEHIRGGKRSVRQEGDGAEHTSFTHQNHQASQRSIVECSLWRSTNPALIEGYLPVRLSDPKLSMQKEQTYPETFPTQ